MARASWVLVVGLCAACGGTPESSPSDGGPVSDGGGARDGGFEACADAEALTGDLELGSADLARLGAVRSVAGRIVIEDGVLTSRIAGCLVSVGALEVREDVELHADAFPALNSVGEDVTIAGARAPDTGSALPALLSVGGDLNLALTRSSPFRLPSVEWVAGDVHIRGAGRPILDVLDSVGGAVTIRDAAMDSLELPALERVSGLWIEDVVGLEDVTLSALQTATATVHISGSALFRVDLSALREVKELTVEGRLSATRLALDALEVVDGSVVLHRIEAVELPRLSTVGGSLAIVEPAMNTTLEAPSLTRVEGLIGVADAPRLEVITFEALSYAGAWIVSGNPRLIEVGMPALRALPVGLALTDNPSVERLVAPLAGAVQTVRLANNPRLRAVDTMAAVTGVWTLAVEGCPELNAMELSSLETAHRLALADTPVALSPPSLTALDELQVVRGGPLRIDLPLVEVMTSIDLFDTTGLAHFAAPRLESAVYFGVRHTTDVHTVELPRLRRLEGFDVIDNASWETCDIEALRDQVLARGGIDTVVVQGNAPCRGR